MISWWSLIHCYFVSIDSNYSARSMILKLLYWTGVICNFVLSNHMSLKLKVVHCVGCGYPSAIVYYDFRYHGMRSRCPKCDSDYPES